MASYVQAILRIGSLVEYVFAQCYDDAALPKGSAKHLVAVQYTKVPNALADILRIHKAVAPIKLPA